jgi:hypothetical protein
VIIKLGHSASKVLISTKEKRPRREIVSAGMSDRRDMDVSTRNILPETKNEERLRIDQACTFSSALEV